ncbi:MAG TPA: hypothetical protein EYP61_02145 [Candidatus Latescibacteria bacterium]|nr:hypothetical protein [Candidatus Latescibacterota bacterium]
MKKVWWLWLSLSLSCLTPIRSVYRVHLTPLSSHSRGYKVDPVDSSWVFTKEGLQVRVKHVPDEELRREVPGPENPFVERGVDFRLGYVPTRFTVFQVTVVNPTFDKVQLYPERAFLVTDRGQVLRPYALNRQEAMGDPRNFETYFLSRGVRSGNDYKLFLERMGVVRASIYHKDSPIFKGKSYTGKIVFDPIPRDAEEVRLVIRDFVLEFGIYDIPKTLITLEFPFSVEQGVVRLREERR